MFKNTMFLVLFSLLASHAEAEAYTASYGLKVTAIYAGYSEKQAYFEVSGSIADPAECGGQPIKVDPARSDVGHVLSVLMYAQASEKTVDLHIYNESCEGGHRVLRRIKVNN